MVVASIIQLTVLSGQSWIATKAVLLRLSAVLADNITVSPGGNPPGSQLWHTLLNWLGQYGLFMGGAAMLAGAALWGFTHRSGHMGGMSRGQELVLGAAIGVAVIGLTPSIINTIFANAH